MIKAWFVFIFAISTQISWGQVPDEFSAFLQNTIDNFQDTASSPGISAAAYVNGYGVWQGASGLSHGGQDMTTDMHLGIASNTKLFTAVLCLQMAQNNLLSLDDSIHHWLPEFANINAHCTLRQLLKHESGIYNYTDNPIFFDASLNDPSIPWTPVEILGLIGDPLFNPGESFSYSNTNYVLAAMILEEATGIAYDVLLRDSIFTQLELNNTFSEGFETIPDPIAHPWHDGEDHYLTPRIALGTLSWAAGCIVSTPTDMVNWYHQLFTQSFLTLESMNQLTDFTSWGGLPVDIGLGVWQIGYNGRTYWGHSGGTIGYRSYFLHDVECGHSVSVIINQTGAGTEYIAKILAESICMLTQIEESKIKTSPTLYPNPCSDHATIVMDETVIKIDVMSLVGEVVGCLQSRTTGKCELDTSGLPNGVYLIAIYRESGVKLEKLVVER